MTARAERGLAVLVGALATLAVLGASPPASAEETPLPADEIKVRHCLDAVSKAESDARACIGVVADPCLEQPNEATTETTIACMTRETELWERLLAARYSEFSSLLDGEDGSQLEAVQEAWIDYRDQRCALGELLYDEDSLADVWAANCILDETGRRAIELDVLIDEVESR